MKVRLGVLRRAGCRKDRGFIDEMGKIVIEQQFELADEFHEGLGKIKQFADLLVAKRKVSKDGCAEWARNFQRKSFAG